MDHDKKYVLKIKTAIETVAKELGIPEYEVTKKQISHLVSDHTFKLSGGIELVKKAYFPVPNKDLSGIIDAKEKSKQVNQQEMKVGRNLLFKEKLLETLEKNIKPIKINSILKPSKKKHLEREVVVSINDAHYGCIVAPEEVGGSNRFDWEIACRRTAFLAQQVIDYKIEKRSEVKQLHVVLNGDILQGAIHDLTARTAELIAFQQIGAMHILTHFISAVAQHYPKVIVHGISGNHDDMPHRREGGRVTSHKYDSFVSPVFAGLSLAFKNCKHISFNFPKSLFIDINLPGGRMLVTHGDTMFSRQLGNPGSSLNIAGLSDAINRFNTGEINKGNSPFKLMLFGHVHNHVHFTTFDGVKVYIPPSLSGIDSYAHSLGINNNQSGQLIFESTKNHILGDARLVDLLRADSNDELDKIIPVYTNNLSLKGE